MTEYFRITGLNNVLFDQAAAAANNRYRLRQNPKGIDEPLTKEQAIPLLRNLPTEIASHILGRPGEHVMSVITFPFSIQGASDTDMEDAEHDLRETLEDGKLYIRTKGARGTRAVVEMKSNLAAAMSYKTVFWGEFIEDAGRAVLGDSIKEHYIEDLQMRLYCEAYWRPATAVTLGPNEIYCPSFEENADSGTPNETADNWVLVSTPTLTWEPTTVLHGCRSQKIVTDGANEGIISTAFSSGQINRPAVAYAWIYKSAGGDVRVQMWEGGAARATSLLSTGGWLTATGKNGNTWHRVVVSGTMPNNANHQLRIIADDAATTFYVDKCYWEWDTLVCPDEWIDHWRAYNHNDSRWVGAAGDEGHMNYVDVDDLKGDAETPIRLQIIPTVSPGLRHALVMRRARGSPACFNHVLEAESPGAGYQWPLAGGDADCSHLEKLIDAGVNSLGYQTWVNLWANMTNDDCGRFRIYARLKTNDSDNTMARIAWRLGDETNWRFGLWRRWGQTGNVWQNVYLGTVDLPLKSLLPPQDWDLRIDYQKDWDDTIEFDWVMIGPDDEERLYMQSAYSFTVGTEFDIDGINEFTDGSVKSTGSDYYLGDAVLKGDFPFALAPSVENRLYFRFVETDSLCDRVHEATQSYFTVSIKYLPQFISPLE